RPTGRTARFRPPRSWSRTAWGRSSWPAGRGPIWRLLGRNRGQPPAQLVGQLAQRRHRIPRASNFARASATRVVGGAVGPHAQRGGTAGELEDHAGDVRRAPAGRVVPSHTSRIKEIVAGGHIMERRLRRRIVREVVEDWIRE